MVREAATEAESPGARPTGGKMHLKSVLHGPGGQARLALAAFAVPGLLAAGAMSAAASSAPAPAAANQAAATGPTTTGAATHAGKRGPTRPATISPGAGLGAAIPAKPHRAAGARSLAAWTVSLTDSINWLWPTQYSTLTATTNVNVGPTPYYLRIYDETANAYVVTCATGTTCAVPVTQQTPATHYYVAVVSDPSASYPPGSVQATSVAVGQPDHRADRRRDHADRGHQHEHRAVALLDRDLRRHDPDPGRRLRVGNLVQRHGQRERRDHPRVRRVPVVLQRGLPAIRHPEDIPDQLRHLVEHRLAGLAEHTVRQLRQRHRHGHGQRQCRAHAVLHRHLQRQHRCPGGRVRGRYHLLSDVLAGLQRHQPGRLHRL